MFLTQDATPAGDAWLAELVAPLDATARVGLSFGPHLPAAGHEPDDRARADRVLRARSARTAAGCGSTTGSRSGDAAQRLLLQRQLGGAARLLGGGPVPRRRVRRGPGVRARRDGGRMAQGLRAGRRRVCTRTTIPSREFMRRYFDEYRGPARDHRPRRAGSPARGRRARRAPGARRTSRYMRGSGLAAGAATRMGTGARCATTPGARCSPRSGSRAERLPAALRRRLSLEGTSGARRTRRPASRGRSRSPYEYVRPHFTGAAGARWRPPSPRRRTREPLHFAWVIPPFRRGSGGHMTLFTIAQRARARGHSCSIWVARPDGRMHRRRAAGRPARADEHFAPLQRGRLQRLRGLARRGRRVRDRLADRLSALDARRLQAEGLSGAGLRAGLLRRVGGAAVGGGDVPHGLSRASRRARGWRELLRERYGAHRGRRSSWASTSTPTGRSTLPRDDRHGRVLRAPLDAAPRDRAGPAGARRAGRAAGRALRVVLFGDTKRAASSRSSTSSRGVLDARRRSRASTTRPRSASSSRSPTTRACRRR